MNVSPRQRSRSLTMTTANASSAKGFIRFGSIPETGQLVEVRRRRWVVTDISSGALSPSKNGDQHLVGLSPLDEDSLGEEIQVVWQIEAGAQVLEKVGLPSITGSDSTKQLEAFLDTVRWGAVTNQTLTTNGYGSNQFMYLHGSMPPDERESVKAAFQTHPDISPVRILLTTDVASEGIDL